MKNIYYSIWVDAIVGIRKNPKFKNGWKNHVFYVMTLLMSVNIGTVSIWYASLASRNNWHHLPTIDIDFSPLPMLNSFSSFFVNFAIIPILLNYFLIFYNNRYELLIKKYNDKKGKLFLIYLFTSTCLLIIPISISFWLQ